MRNEFRFARLLRPRARNSRQLTMAERQVALGMCALLSDEEIARALGITRKTVNTRATRVLRIFGGCRREFAMTHNAALSREDR